MIKFAKRISLLIIAGLLSLLYLPGIALAAGISPSGGGKVVVGQTFTVTVRASGAEFDSLQGTISVSGPVSIVSFSAGSATWLPGKSPANNNQFVGIVSPTSSLTIATIKLKATKEGSGAVSVSSVRLARSGNEVGSSGGSTSFTVGRAPTPPGGITITSSTHPDQNQPYEATTVALSWDKPSGVDGFSTVFDDTADTTPGANITTSATSTEIKDAAVGTHYFHIRGHNGDGWGPVTHYKVTIKEPDAKIDPTLSAPTITGIEKTADFTNDITAGTVQGFVIKGAGGLTDFSIKLAITPADHLPAELTLISTPNADGSWSYLIDKPISAGFYTLTAQSQKDKVLSPISTTVYFETSVANGGQVKIITEDDKPKVANATSSATILGIHFRSKANAWLAFSVFILAVAALATGSYLYYRKRFKRV